jgi:hypothetical protein
MRRDKNVLRAAPSSASFAGYASRAHASPTWRSSVGRGGLHARALRWRFASLVTGCAGPCLPPA